MRTFLLIACLITQFPLLAQIEKVKLAKDFVSIESLNKLYVNKHEVTNLEFRGFLNELKRSGKTEIAKQLAPDSTQWQTLDSIVLQYYGWHSGYTSYPVVNVSYQAVLAYCQYLADKINSELKGKQKVVVRLLTEKEWEEMAFAMILPPITSKEVVLPWSGYFNWPDKAGKFKANTKFLIENGRYDFASDGFLYQAPIMKFPPNDFGIYDVIGNVSEMVSSEGISKGGSWDNTIDQCFVKKNQHYDGPNPRVGFRVCLEVIK